MFSKNQFFKPMMTASLSKMAALKHSNTFFRQKSGTSVIQIHHQPIVLIKFTGTKHSSSNDRLRQCNFPKYSSWSDLLTLGKTYESAGSYDASEECFQEIIKRGKKAKSPLPSLQKQILIEAYYGIADIIHIRSHEDEDRAIDYLDKILQLDRNNSAAFELKRSILGERCENTSTSAVLTPYRKTF